MWSIGRDGFGRCRLRSGAGCCWRHRLGRRRRTYRPARPSRCSALLRGDCGGAGTRRLHGLPGQRAATCGSRARRGRWRGDGGRAGHALGRALAGRRGREIGLEVRALGEAGLRPCPDWREDGPAAQRAAGDRRRSGTASVLVAAPLARHGPNGWTADRSARRIAFSCHFIALNRPAQWLSWCAKAAPAPGRVGAYWESLSWAMRAISPSGSCCSS